MKATECWFEAGPNGEHVFEPMDYFEVDDRHRRAVVLWKDDYDALQQELKECRALIKECFRCHTKDFHEFVRRGKDEQEYCESCWDHMFTPWPKA
ncbi:MAG: hypothetical protein E6R03_05615 [Hyphomicrobiaceae bacterium]|nr:MAG: hypothetical protein E6R03_05615 [Hyphomicrobiaceae bacterium]